MAQGIFRRPVTLLACFALALTGISLSGCSDDSVFPICENCENWTQITVDLGRMPDPHPTQPEFVAFSTIAKTPGALDANREADEDVWIAWRQPGSENDPTLNVVYQITGEGALAIGDNEGDNFSPRWNPSGTEIAFLHTTAAGDFEVWRIAVTLPATPDAQPVLGTPELVVEDARDPAWESDTQLYFTRADKLYVQDLMGLRGGTDPRQISFRPPAFASTDDYVDRHPDFAPDGGAIFDTQGRDNVAELRVEAFEVTINDQGDTLTSTPTEAFISFFPPDAIEPSYPIFIGADTLQTPITLSSLPVATGGQFIVGVRRDSRFMADSLAESYCDTLITQTIDLQPGDSDTLRYYFRQARGNLEVFSGLGPVQVSWSRADGRSSIDDFGGPVTLGGGPDGAAFNCLLSFPVLSDGTIDESRLEPYLVVGQTFGDIQKADSVLVNLPPDSTVTVNLFPVGRALGNIDFADQDSIFPPVDITAFEAGTTVVCGGGFSSQADGSFVVSGLIAGTYDLLFEQPGGLYQNTTVTNVVIQPPKDTSVGVVVMQPSGASAAPQIVQQPLSFEEAPPVARMATTIRPIGSDRELTGASLQSILRAPGDVSTLWRLDVTDPDSPRFVEVFGSQTGFLQNPALTSDLGSGVRYLAYVSDETGDWLLYVARLQDVSGTWLLDGITSIATPGTFDNLSCERNAFHPRWSSTSGGQLRLLVALTDCPDNGFEDLGIDDNPWAQGELRVWEVEIDPSF